MSEPEPESGRDRIDLLAEEFAERLRKGESPSISEFAAREAGDTGEVQALLASVAMIEQWKRQKLQPHGGPGPTEEGGGAPERLGDFRIVRELGRGGMGIVYEAEQTSLGRHVAVKVLPRHSLLEPTRRQRFQHEAQTAAGLHHTNIVPIFGAGEHEGLHYIVMQLIDGRGLDVVLREWKRAAIQAGKANPGGGSKPEDRHWRRVARIGVEAAWALQYAHEQGVLHRDVKPANLLLDRQGVVWVTDFGLAKMVERESLSNSGDIIGTLQYMAPERFETEADARSDVYSLGLTLYELLTFEPAFQEASPSKLLRRVSEGHPLHPRNRNAAIPRDLETIVLKAIAREPEHRYPTAGALADDLARYLDDRPVRARRASPVERLTRWGRRNRAVAALSATVLASLLLAAVVGWAGYAGTARALERESLRRGEAELATRRAEENVALSLGAFEDLFNRLAPHDSGPPDQLSAAGEPPPPPPPPPPADDMGIGPDDRRPPPPPGPAGPPEDVADLLQSVLAFYDKFAAKNATNDHLHREAARANRRVGDIERRLGRDLEAESAYRRAAELFEALVAKDPSDPDLRYELASTYATAPPGDEGAASLAREEKTLRRALALGEPLAAESPSAVEPVLLVARVHGRLGGLLGRAGRRADAVKSLRLALALEEPITRRGRAAFPHHLALADARLSLADLLRTTDDGREEALTLLGQCRDDLEAAFSTGPPGRRTDWVLRPRVERLAVSLRALGETALADDVLDMAPPPFGYPPPRFPGPEPEDDGGPGPRPGPPPPHEPPGHEGR